MVASYSYTAGATYGQGVGPETPSRSGSITCKITFDQARRLLMLDMRWKALDRAMNLS